MKKTIFLLFILLGSYLISPAQDERKIAFQKGTMLLYDFVQNDNTFPLTITIESITPDFVISFKLDGPKKKSGKVTILKKAFQKSMNLEFDFDQPKMKLDYATFIVLSQVFFGKLDSLNDLVANSQIEQADSARLFVSLKKGEKPVILGKVSKEIEDIAVNSKDTKLYTYIFQHYLDDHGKEVDFGSSYIFRVARNAEFPFLTYANMVTYYIAIKEVKNAQWLIYNYSINEYERVNELIE